MKDVVQKDSPTFEILKDEKLQLRNRCGKRVNGRALFLETEGLKDLKTIVFIRASQTTEFIETVFASFKLGIDILLVPEKISDKELISLLEEVRPEYFLSFKKEEVLEELENKSFKYLDYNFQAEKIDKEYSLKTNSKIHFLTSGSTSSSKIVIHSLERLLIAAEEAAGKLEIDQGSKILLSLPLSHIGGFSLLLRAQSSGATLLVPGLLKQKEISQTIKLFRPSHVSLVPSLFKELLLEYSAEEFSFLSKVLISGAKIEQSLINSAKEKNIPTVYSYGSTESGAMFIISSNKSEDAAFKEIFTGMEFKISDSEPKELEIRGQQMFLGYFKESDTDYQKSWFKTGDLVKEAAGGGFKVLGRKDRIIIKGGENINPYKLESLALEVKGVKEAAIISKTSRKWGEVPVLFIESSEDNCSLKKSLKNKFKESLSSFFVPEEIKILDEIPRLSSGKINYSRLR